MGWMCLVRKINDTVKATAVEGISPIYISMGEYKMFQKIQSKLPKAKIVFETNDLTELFENLPSCSIVLFDSGVYKFEKIHIPLTSTDIRIKGILDPLGYPTLVFRELKLSQYTMISSLNLVGGEIKHIGKVLLDYCRLSSVKISDMLTINSYISKSKLQGLGVYKSNHLCLMTCILEACELRNLGLDPGTKLDNCQIFNL